MRAVSRLTLAVLALACATPLALHAASQDFALVNRTGFRIDSIHVSEVGKGVTGNNVLGRDWLDDGETVNITFPRETRVCRWDLVVQYHDREQAVWNNLDLCNIARMALFWNRQTHATFARAE